MIQPVKATSRAKTVVLARDPLPAGGAFLPEIVKGLLITARRFFSNLFWRKHTATIPYPEEKAKYPARHRGLHRLMLREDESVRCVACMMCPTVCPADCISIVPGEREDSNEKFPIRFEIDELRCVVCGLCVEVCPCDAIRMDTGLHALPVTFRGDAILGKADLLSRGELSTAKQGGHGHNWRDLQPPK